jgi:hypothetical protein
MGIRLDVAISGYRVTKGQLDTRNRHLIKSLCLLLIAFYSAVRVQCTIELNCWKYSQHTPVIRQQYNGKTRSDAP